MSLSVKALEIISDTIETQFGGKLSDAARFFDVPYQTLYSWLARQNRQPKLSALSPVLEKIGVTLSAPDKRLIDFEFIPKVMARPGAGASLETSGEIAGYYAFRSDFMGAMNLHKKSCLLMEVVGDSMNPTIANGDTVLIDKEDTSLRDGKIYVFTLFDELRIKRIVKTIEGLNLISDNKTIPPINVNSSDLSQLIIHGRVRWIGKCV